LARAAKEDKVGRIVQSAAVKTRISARRDIAKRGMYLTTKYSD